MTVLKYREKLQSSINDMHLRLWLRWLLCLQLCKQCPNSLTSNSRSQQVAPVLQPHNMSGLRRKSLDYIWEMSMLVNAWPVIKFGLLVWGAIFIISSFNLTWKCHRHPLSRPHMSSCVPLWSVSMAASHPRPETIPPAPTKTHITHDRRQHAAHSSH